MNDIKLRIATPEDAPSLLGIYAPYVNDTAITFEYTLPSEDEFRERIKNTLQNYPYLVAYNSDKIVGYAYAGEFKAREAYRHSVETTVYVDINEHSRGIGRALYDGLEKYLLVQNVINLNACIAFTKEQDPHLPDASPAFHEKLGYKKVAHFSKCGWKFGKWYDMIWMEKMLAEHTDNPKDFIPFRQIIG